MRWKDNNLNQRRHLNMCSNNRPLAEPNLKSLEQSIHKFDTEPQKNSVSLIHITTRYRCILSYVSHM